MAQQKTSEEKAPKKDGKGKELEPPKEEELSEEDLKLKTSLEALVTRLRETDAKAVASAIESIGNEIRSATTSMSSVPKPLKFLRPQYDTIKAAYDAVPKECKQALADVISVLATVSDNQEDRESLKFRTLGTGADPGSWGHEYMRHLAGEIAAEYAQRLTDDKDTADLLDLVKAIVPHHMKQNAEPEAVDLLLEVDEVRLLLEHIDASNYARACLYLTSTAAYLAEPDDAICLATAYDAYMKVEKWHDAMRVALRLNDHARVERTFAMCADPLDKQQLAYLLARQGHLVDVDDGAAAIADDTLREKVSEILNNTHLSSRYLALARDLDVMEPKLPEDVYKMHLVDGRPGALANIDSSSKNISATLVNALLNVGFCADKLVLGGDDAKSWIFRNREHGVVCAVASIGALNLWDVEGGLPQIDKYTYSDDPHVVAGACLGFGLCCCGVRSDLDPAYALLYEHVSSQSAVTSAAAVTGLGLAYAGTQKEEVRELLVPLLGRSGDAALALGLVYTATADQEVVEGMLQALMMLPEDGSNNAADFDLVLGLGFLFLGKQADVEPTLEVVKALPPYISRYAQVVLDMCAYAGSGNVLKIQEMLALCGEHIDITDDSDKWKAKHLGPAAIGIGLIACGEDLGAQMATRMLEHLLTYGDPPVRAAVPLALALLHTSSPEVYTMDTLSRLSHDADGAVAKAALLSLGVLGAGTNNARLAGILRNLSSYYGKDASALHLVRLAQGLLHLGKGLCTLSPMHSDRQLLSPVALAANLSLLFSGLDSCRELIGARAARLYYVFPAVRPRFLMTVDEAGDSVPVTVRVGTAVDTVAQAGQPKAITGFQTHDTPVLLAAEDRAEFATEKFTPVTPLLEGVVIVKPNPNYVEGDL